MMNQIKTKQLVIPLLLGLLGWALCGAIMFVGMAITDIQTTLIVHVIGAPIIFSLISWFYFVRFNYTSPFQTALLFIGMVMFVDFFLVALIINKSLEMFQSPLGTWIPFALIFLSTYVTGIIILKSRT
ncbi:MAG: hypothetical protein ACQ9ET_05850 [Nitrosomonadaceae bacterium]